MFRIVNAVTRETPVDPVARVLETGQVVGLANHTALIARDGSECQIYDSAAPIRDAEDRMVGVVLVFSDVTEQYRLQQVLVESEERYRALVQSSPVGVVVHARREAGVRQSGRLAHAGRGQRAASAGPQHPGFRAFAPA